MVIHRNSPLSRDSAIHTYIHTYVLLRRIVLLRSGGNESDQRDMYVDGAPSRLGIGRNALLQGDCFRTAASMGSLRRPWRRVLLRPLRYRNTLYTAHFERDGYKYTAVRLHRYLQAKLPGSPINTDDWGMATAKERHSGRAGTDWFAVPCFGPLNNNNNNNQKTEKNWGKKGTQAKVILYKFQSTHSHSHSLRHTHKHTQRVRERERANTKMTSKNGGQTMSLVSRKKIKLGSSPAMDGVRSISHRNPSSLLPFGVPQLSTVIPGRRPAVRWTFRVPSAARRSPIAVPPALLRWKGELNACKHSTPKAYGSSHWTVTPLRCCSHGARSGPRPSSF